MHTYTLDGAGGPHVKTHYQPQRLTGVGVTTGDKHNAAGATQGEYSVRSDGSPYEDTYVNSCRIIGQRKGNNYLVHENWHITVNANGEVTAELDN